MKVHIFSSAPIVYEIPPHDLYDSFDLVSQGKLYAPIKPAAKDIISNFDFQFDVKSIKRILTARGGQTLDTAQLIIGVKKLQDVEIIQTENLNGVRFAMSQLVGKEDFLQSYNLAIARARQNFIIRLFNNQLTESCASVIKRMGDFLGELKDFSAGTVCISHGFYMKLLEIYAKTPEKFEDLNTLIEAFEPLKKPYEPLHGFYIDI